MTTYQTPKKMIQNRQKPVYQNHANFNWAKKISLNIGLPNNHCERKLFLRSKVLILNPCFRFLITAVAVPFKIIFCTTIKIPLLSCNVFKTTWCPQIFHLLCLRKFTLRCRQYYRHKTTTFSTTRTTLIISGFKICSTT